MSPQTKPVESLTINEAIAERQDLIREVTDIQDDLGNRNRVGPDGKRLTSIAYWEWHRKATHALRMRQKRMADLKEHIRRERLKATNGFANVDDPSTLGLLRRAYNLLTTLASEEVEFEEDEQALVDAIRAHLHHGQQEKR